MSNKEYYVYGLTLKGGNKYIGHTSNPEKRLNDHLSGKGSKCTQKFTPTKIDFIHKCSNQQAAKNAERHVYYNYKNYHGSDKVRGAGNTNSNYGSEKAIKNKATPNNSCYVCGRKGHCANNCYAKTTVNGDII